MQKAIFTLKSKIIISFVNYRSSNVKQPDAASGLKRNPWTVYLPREGKPPGSSRGAKMFYTLKTLKLLAVRLQPSVDENKKKDKYNF